MEKGTLGVQFLVASCSRARGSELVSGVQCAFYWAFTKLKYKIWDTGKDGDDDDDADDDHNEKGDGDDDDACNSDADDVYYYSSNKFFSCKKEQK